MSKTEQILSVHEGREEAWATCHATAKLIGQTPTQKKYSTSVRRRKGVYWVVLHESE